MAETEITGTDHQIARRTPEPSGTAQNGSRSSDIFTSYLHKPVEISIALRTLRNQHAKLQLTFEGEPTVYSARILDVSDKELLLENLVPRSGLRLMTSGRRFAFSARADGVYLHSEENRVRKIDEERGVPFFRVALPNSVLYQQRRRAARYRLSLRTTTMPANITLLRDVVTDRDHGATLEGRVLDISAGGCRVQVEGPIHPPLTADEVLKSCDINIPKLLDLKVDAVIRHASYEKQTRTVTCGVEFSSMRITDRRRLEQFIQALARSLKPGSVGREKTSDSA